MPDIAYTKRELDLLFKNLNEKNDAWSGTILQKITEIERDKIDPILIQTNKTNGRVSRLERWQAYVIGFCACVTILIIPALLLLIGIHFKGL